MKKVLFLVLFLLTESVFAQQDPALDELKDTHWTLKKMLCESGLPPSPGIEKGTRYDVHFLSEGAFELLISMPRTFSIVKGKYSYNSETQLCLNEKYALTSGNPPFYYDRETCVFHTVNRSQMTWQLSKSEDCPEQDRQILIFEKQ